jgi:hypothetical protein
VKRIRRAVAAALISSTAVAATLLSTLVPAQAATVAAGALATPVPPPPSTVLAGTWVNTNHATRSVADIVVSTSPKGIAVDGFGACTPTPCEFGRIPGTVFGPNVSATVGTSFAAQWNFTFKRTIFLATYSAPGRVPTLTVQEFNTFTDGSGRVNYTATETFTKGKAVRVTKNGVSASDYPLGAPVGPATTLPAIWINTAATGNVRAVILSLGPFSGLLQVHAYGFCSPVPCNWGTVTGITFGPSVVATSGGVFLAPYHFAFANKLLDGRVNAAGTLLTVQTWTEFTDNSHRSNYVTTESFVPLR